MSELSANAQSVANAITSLNANFSQDAHKQLLEFQRTREAWQVSIELLQKVTDPQVVYMAASTLDAKIRTEWSTLDPQSQQELRGTILQHLQSPLVDQKEHFIVNRLCSALANMAVHLIPTGWPNMFEDLMGTIHGNQDVVMLELLELLPSQLYDSIISREHFKAVEDIFQSNVDRVLDLCTELLQQSIQNGVIANPFLLERTLKCINGWLAFGVKLSTLLQRPLLPMIFQIFHAPNVSNKVTSAAVGCITDAFAVPLRSDFHEYVHQLFRSVSDLAPVLQRAVEQGDDDLLVSLTTLVTGLAEGQPHILADNSPESLALVDLLLGLMGTNEWEIANRTLDSWFKLQDHLTRIIAPTKVEFVSASQVLIENSKKNEKMNNYIPRYRSMLQLLLPFVQYPVEDELSTWDLEDYNELRVRRDTVAELFVSVSLIMRADMLTFAVELMEPVLRAFEAEHASASWQTVEVILHMTQAVVGWHYTTDEHLPAIFELMPRLPPHERVVQATLTLIGVSASWLRGNTDMLAPSVDYVLSALSRDFAQPIKDPGEHPSGAPQAFLDVASICGGLLAPKLQGIIDILGPVMTNIDPQGKCTIIRGLTHIVSYLPLNEIGEALLWLVSPITERLKEFSELPKERMSEQSVLDTMLAEITMMSCTVPFVVPPVTSEKALAVSEAYPIEMAWGPLMTILQKWVMIPVVVDSICEFCTMAFEFLHLLKGRLIWPHFLEAAVQALLLSHTPTIIDTVNRTFVMLWDKCQRQPQPNPAVKNEILEPFNRAFEIIAADTVKILREQQGQNVELTAVLYKLVTIMLDGSPEVIVSSTALPSILEGAVVYLNLPSHESRASKVVISSLKLMAVTTREPFGAPLLTLFNQFGKEITSAIFRCMIGSAQRDYQELVSVLYYVRRATRDKFRPWLYELLMQPDWPNTNVTAEDKTRLHEKLTDDLSFSVFHGEVTDFILACRRGIGT